jgi:hypothetical protein
MAVPSELFSPARPASISPSMPPCSRVGSLPYVPAFFCLAILYLAKFVETGKMYRSYGDNFGGYYDTSSNFLTNSYKYLFTPLFQFTSFTKLIISFENMFLLLLFILALCRLNINYQKSFFTKPEVIFSILFFILGIIVLSNFTSNMGISVRQKWMVLPSFLLIIINLIHLPRKQ